MSKKAFSIKLLKPEKVESAYFVVPFNVPEVYGTKASSIQKNSDNLNWHFQCA